MLLRRDLLEGIHARDADGPAEGQRLDAVLGLATTDGPQAWPESDEELLDLDPKSLCREEVARLVDHHHDQEGYGEDEDTEGLCHLDPFKRASLQRFDDL